MNKENNFDETIDFLDEEVCVTLNVNDKDVSEISTRHFSAIYRKKPLVFLEENEIGIPLTALLLDSPINQKPLLVEILDDSALIDENDKELSVRNYFKDYARKAIKGPLGIYLKYGVNLECHQQNTILVFENGVLQRSLVRDTNGIDIHKPSFDKTGIDLTLHPKTNQYFQDRGLRVHLIHCLFTSHLSEIIRILAKAYSLDDQLLWSDLYEVVDSEIDKYKDFMSVDEWQTERSAILEDAWTYKALMLMRIADTKEIFISTDNPFASVKRMVQS